VITTGDVLKVESGRPVVSIDITGTRRGDR
jgi:hypothetical protein